jgi:HTH-type transcriptional regulator, glycine betaine synthesis regulator
MNESSKNDFVLKMGELSTLFGFSHVLGQIYGLLYLTPGELSLDDIKDSLSVSKATVSLNIRELLKWGAVKRIWKPGTRRDYYEAEVDFLKIFNTRLVDALLRRVRIFEDGALHVLQDKSGVMSDRKEREFLDQRLEEIKKISRLLKKVLMTIKDSENSSILKKLLFKAL